MRYRLALVAALSAGAATSVSAQAVRFDSLARAFSTPRDSFPTGLGARATTFTPPPPTLAAEPEVPPAPRDTAFTVDRVVAVVGNTPILASQVDEEIFSRQSQGTQLPKTAEGLAALRREVIDNIIEAELLVQQAERDTAVKVTDQEVAEGVEQQIRKVRGNFSTEAEYAAELKKAGFQTPDEYRRWLGDQQRRSTLQNRLIEKLKGDGTLKAVIPTEREMRAYFDAQKAQLGKRPATLSFRQVVVPPTPSLEARQAAYQLADSIARALRQGGDFAVAAKRFSADSGSRERGGSLNWFRRGVMVPEFERVAFGIKPGVISDPVETQFGFHVIQVERAQPAEVQARHILIMPEITQVEIDSAKRIAETLYRALTTGAGIDSLQRRFHEKTEEREGKDIPVDKLPPAYAQAIGNAEEGTVLPPFPIEGGNERTRYAVVQLTARRPEGDIRFEDVRDKIRSQLGEQLAIRRYIDHLRKSSYVEIRTGQPDSTQAKDVGTR
ncbi:MAG TPA: peptidylprolyl isomerase [Gemmatimonadales bacterium]|nr:peptidylprolyl isomerase [Gemmatimonadales bacterium]